MDEILSQDLVYKFCIISFTAIPKIKKDKRQHLSLFNGKDGNIFILIVGQRIAELLIKQ